MLTLIKARKIVDQAIRRARELSVNVSVAVCDNRGRLIALNQMDGSVSWEVDRSSMAKAVAAAVMGRPSDQLFEPCLKVDRGCLQATMLFPLADNVVAFRLLKRALFKEAAASAEPRQKNKTRSAPEPALQRSTGWNRTSS